MSDEQVKCHECGQTFKSDHELREHNEKMHKDKGQHAGQVQGQHQQSGQSGQSQGQHQQSGQSNR